MADKKVDKVVLEGGLGAPIVHGDFSLYEFSIISHSNTGKRLELNHDYQENIGKKKDGYLKKIHLDGFNGIADLQWVDEYLI